MAENLKQHGYTPIVLDVRGFNMKSDAHNIAAQVDKTHSLHPHTPIHVVTHSIGAISARYFLKFLGGSDFVKSYISIGAPQYGSPGACGEIVGGEVCTGTDFMKKLNKGDDTPGQTKYYSIRSSHEWTDGRLDGGQCRMTPFKTAGNGGLDHSLEPFNKKVWKQVRQALNGHCIGKYVDEPDGSIHTQDTLFPDGVPFT
ncbi:hypothetical protein MVES1_003276 [Malassezia vespertilionis]|uniref:AB hydrolase-1 domain-containing protein n=1 Tax=Malassezia vespertilionis TaxID=2020962 RepID=A0A2N1J6T4_9BASI|nr:uncharacterized protein MVES1_003276 [Malassezia vespertilionis]PKI82275.1 hypothetical protein MVES_003806 [Malassezia vespertilionis]WFD07907.1 hypothetical protein MVES1_003276 [Malassezia vespertilionis]